MQIGEILGHSQNQDQLHPLGRLKVRASRHLDPAPRAQVFLPKEHHAHQRDDGSDVEPMYPVEQLLVVNQADQKHAGHAAYDPINLPDMRPGKLGMRGRAANLHHPQPADHQDKDEEQPVEITE